ncbi:MAG: methyltransferase domain-containing protein [Desulfarculus sp.]|nr:MAG: methyltransferase domain-containing protein [Desulfarculus sp.]
MKPPPDIKPPAWLEVLLSAPLAQAEAAADYLTALSGRGVQLSAAPEEAGQEQVRAFLAAGPELAQQKAQVQAYARELAALAPPGAVTVSFRALPPEDWSLNWKKHFHPRLVARRIIVAPPWEPASPAEGQVVIVIDPGQAFGTGQHESTQLVLRRIERLADQGHLPGRVLDVGCGSGILALAALRLGAASALAIDIDPQAVEAARANARLNGLSQGLEANLTPLDQIGERFPLVLANLTAKDLMELAGPLAARLAPGGELVASGLLVEQIGPVRQAFAGLGLSLVEQDSLAGWAALVLA